MFNNFFGKFFKKKNNSEKSTNTKKIKLVNKAVQTQVSHVNYRSNKINIKELPYSVLQREINERDSVKIIKYSTSVINQIMKMDATGKMLQGIIDREEKLNIWEVVEKCYKSDVSIEKCIQKLNRVEIDECYPFKKDCDVTKAREYARKVLDEIIKRNPYGHLLDEMSKTNIWKIIEHGFINNKSIDFVIDGFEDDI